MSDYISRADAIEAVASITMSIHLSDVICDKLLALPSADAVEVDRTSEWVAVRREEYEDYLAKSAEADGEDLIIKGAKGIQDGLYNIKDGKLFKYKAKGGTVRTYPIVPSAEQTDKLENQPRLVERNYTTEGGGGEIYHPTRQQGEWIWRTDIPIGDGRTSAGYICSNCGKDYWHGNVFKYCPSCGARMKGGDGE